MRIPDLIFRKIIDALAQWAMDHEWIRTKHFFYRLIFSHAHFLAILPLTREWLELFLGEETYYFCLSSLWFLISSYILLYPMIHCFLAYREVFPSPGELFFRVHLLAFLLRLIFMNFVVICFIDWYLEHPERVLFYYGIYGPFLMNIIKITFSGAFLSTAYNIIVTIIYFLKTFRILKWHRRSYWRQWGHRSYWKAKIRWYRCVLPYLWRNFKGFLLVPFFFIVSIEVLLLFWLPLGQCLVYLSQLEFLPVWIAFFGIIFKILFLFRNLIRKIKQYLSKR